MIDSHCHLTDPRIGKQLESVLARCAENGVHDTVTIATTPEDGVEAHDLAMRHHNIRYAVGIHPNETNPYTVADVNRLRSFIGDKRCVALGEMGLDYHWKDVPVAHQKAMFRAQLDLAREAAMPVIIHCREAVMDTLEIMQAYCTVKAVFHCFTGTVEEARAITGAGYCIGFTGPLTFKKNDALRQAAAEAPAGQILIETDAPYLAPEPHRGVKINEPMYVRFVLETLARIRGISVAEADQLTTENTQRLYRWT